MGSNPTPAAKKDPHTLAYSSVPCGDRFMEVLCNGSTTDFDSVGVGSIPTTSANSLFGIFGR